MTEFTEESITELTIASTTVLTTEQITVKPSETWFMSPTCSDTTLIGLTCHVSNMSCNISKPCKNNGICTNTNNTTLGYPCECPIDFIGISCEVNHRLCEPNPCWNDGEYNIFNTTFNFTCASGWQDNYCQTKINYCENIIYVNHGICRPLFRNFTYEYLAERYYGLYCEITATKLLIYQIVSKSFGYIAIITIVSVATFMIVMDILKYYFGIDPTYNKRRRIQQIKRTKKDAFYNNRPFINSIPPLADLRCIEISI